MLRVGRSLKVLLIQTEFASQACCYGGCAINGPREEPELFWRGVLGWCDRLRLMFQSSWTNDASELWQQYGLPVFVGDLVKDAERPAATSPVELTDKIGQPLPWHMGQLTVECRLSMAMTSMHASRRRIRKLSGYVITKGHGWLCLRHD